MLQTTRDVTTLSCWRGKNEPDGTGFMNGDVPSRVVPAGSWIRVVSLGTDLSIVLDGDPPGRWWRIPRGETEDGDWDDVVDVRHPGADDTLKDPDGAWLRRDARGALKAVEGAALALTNALRRVGDWREVRLGSRAATLSTLHQMLGGDGGARRQADVPYAVTYLVEAANKCLLHAAEGLAAEAKALRKLASSTAEEQKAMQGPWCL